jgi:hypothetical protein
LKIVGVVSDYNEAKDIENIVKVFVIKQRICNLLSLEKEKNFEKVESNFNKFQIKEVEFPTNSDKKYFHEKIIDDSSPVFNVRGLV